MVNLSIDSIFQSFSQMKAIVVGDLMLDRYTIGTVDRESPEAPVPIVVQTNEEIRLGGAGNVALNLKSLGAEVYLFGITGKDVAGEDVRGLLRENKISADYIRQDSSRPTTVKQRVVAERGQLLRVDFEETTPISPDIQTNILAGIKSLIPEVDVLIFQDYDKGLLNSGIIKEVIQRCRENNLPCLVDPKERNFNNYAGATLFKPNLRELEFSMQIEIDPTDVDQLLDAYRHLKSSMNISALLLTLSENGLFICNDLEKHLIPTAPVLSPDVSGAGDTVAAIAGLSLAAGLPLQTIGHWANQAGRQVCQFPGVVPVSKIMLMEELKNLH